MMLLVAVFCSGWKTHEWYQRFQSTRVPKVATRGVLVAAVDIPLDGSLDATKVRLEQWPVDKIPAGTIVDVAELDGCISRASFFPGEPIRLNKVSRLHREEDTK